MTMQQSFFLGEDQRIFRESLARWLEENWSVRERQRHGAEDPGFSRKAWKGLAEIGALGAFLPEEAGGAGGGGLELMIAMEAFGRALFTSPFLSTVPLTAPLLAAGSPQAQALLGKIAGGEAIVSVALTEPRGRYDLNHVETQAERRGKGYLLSGAKRGVPYAAAADWIVLPARSAGEAREGHGITLFLVEAGRKGMTLRSHATADGGRAAELELRELEAEESDVLGEPGKGLELLQHAVDLAILAQCAEAVGAMRRLQESTVAYAKTREQFGQTLGSFQALQHRMVDMFAAAESSASRVQAALARITGLTSPVDPRDAVLTKLYVDKAARFVGQEAVQIHGGMGMTDDLDVGHHFKRLAMMALTFADQGKLDERYRALQGSHP
jgi:alkylation response protein AidB-like acyl-CoA dehydrogenase